MQLLPSMDHVALIPRKNKGVEECTVMPQWQGYKSLMERHPDVLEVNCDLVHVSDELRVNAGQVSHSYDPLDENRSIDGFKDIRGGYLKVLYTNTSRQPKYHFVTVKEIEKRSKCAQTKNVWQKWFREMAMKTVYRDGFARRIVPFDTLVNLKAITAADDRAMDSDPMLVNANAQLSSPDKRVLPREEEPGDLQPPEPELKPQEKVELDIADAFRKAIASKSPSNEDDLNLVQARYGEQLEAFETKTGTDAMRLIMDEWMTSEPEPKAEGDLFARGEQYE